MTWGKVYLYCCLFCSYLAESDFIGANTLLLFLPGVSELCINITIIRDTTLENNEQLFVLLSTSDLHVDLAPASAVVTVSDNDGEGSPACRNKQW